MDGTIVRSDRFVGVLGILIHLAAAIVYLLLPGLVVPYPALYGFQAAWIVVLLVVLRWFGDHPRRALALAIAGAILAGVFRILGEQFLGWRG